MARRIVRVLRPSGPPDSQAGDRRRAPAGLVLLVPALLAGVAAGALAGSRAGSPPPAPEYTTLEHVRLTDAALGLQREQDDLKRQLAQLRAQFDAIQEQSARTDAATRELRDRVRALQQDAGLTDLSGEGLVVTLDDAHVAPNDPRAVPLAIVHSQDLTDLFNAAWKGGARGVAVNGERITGTSACVGATIQINGTLLSPPFVVSIVGPRDRLRRVFDDPRELADLHARSRAFGLRFDVATADTVRVPAYTGPLGVHYARSR